MALTYPHLKVTIPEDGRTIFTRVELDGKAIPATRVAFDTGEVSADGFVKIRLEFVGSVDFESGTPLKVDSDAATAAFADTFTREVGNSWGGINAGDAGWEPVEPASIDHALGRVEEG